MHYQLRYVGLGRLVYIDIRTNKIQSVIGYILYLHIFLKYKF